MYLVYTLLIAKERAQHEGLSLQRVQTIANDPQTQRVLLERRGRLNFYSVEANSSPSTANQQTSDKTADQKSSNKHLKK